MERKTMTSNERPRRARCVALLALASALGLPVAVAAGCGGVASQPPTVGGESHFLQYCDDDCAAGLDCIAGVCTKGCLVSDMSSCSAFAGAVCTAASVEPGAVAVCDVDCAVDADCSGLGSAHRCEGGFCRSPGGSSGMGGGMGGSAPVAMGGSDGMGPPVGNTGGTSTGGGGSMVDCDMYRFLDNPPQLEVVIRNERNAPVYVPQMIQTPCSGYPTQFRRGGALVDLSPGFCGNSCEEVQDEGATSPGGGAAPCPALCVADPLVAIGPGQERRYVIDALEIVNLEMPNDCFSGDFESVTCFNRIGLPPAQYDVSLAGFTEFVCPPELTPCDCAQPTPDGICPPNINQGSGEMLTATASFAWPSSESMSDTSLMGVTLTFNQAQGGPP